MRVWSWMRSLSRARPCGHAAREAHQRTVCSVFRGAAAPQSRVPRLIRPLDTGRAVWGRPSSLSLRAVYCYATSVGSEDVSVDVGLSVEGEPHLRCCTSQRDALAAFSWECVLCAECCSHSTCWNRTASSVLLCRSTLRLLPCTHAALPCMFCVAVDRSWKPCLRRSIMMLSESCRKWHCTCCSHRVKPIDMSLQVGRGMGAELLMSGCQLRRNNMWPCQVVCACLERRPPLLTLAGIGCDVFPCTSLTKELQCLLSQHVMKPAPTLSGAPRTFTVRYHRSHGTFGGAV
mgnify:CR=1 FL=1